MIKLYTWYQGNTSKTLYFPYLILDEHNCKAFRWLTGGWEKDGDWGSTHADDGIMELTDKRPNGRQYEKLLVAIWKVSTKNE